MVRWRCYLVLAMLLLIPVKTNSKVDDDDDEERDDETDENEDEDEDDDEDQGDKTESVGRRAPALLSTLKSDEMAITRTTKKRPLECFACTYKSETPLRSCLDPTKYSVHTITCHSLEDKCFTSVISRGSNFKAVVRGCRPECIGTTETTCCELNRCNNQAFTMPVISPRVADTSNKQQSLQQDIVFFITVLLILQTVVKIVLI